MFSTVRIVHNDNAYSCFMKFAVCCKEVIITDDEFILFKIDLCVEWLAQVAQQYI
jgi:hypothetical protein